MNMWQVEMKTPLSLKPGKEGSNFVVIKPTTSSKYRGVAACDPAIKPERIGGTWNPYPPSSSDGKVGDVILHFHGGAYVIGDGRYADAGFAAKTLLQGTSATHVFCPQYRLTSNGDRFPSQLQDAITSLSYLTETLGITVDKITISGDSAGANLCLCLLRYIADNKEADVLQPKCCFLWSLWVDPGGSLVARYLHSAPNAPTDYLTDGFGAWGARTYAPAKSTGILLTHPNINFKGTAFKSGTPIFFSAGECEALYHDILVVEKEFKDAGNTTEMSIAAGAVHDIILVGGKTGFQEVARKDAKRAGAFLERCK